MKKNFPLTSILVAAALCEVAAQAQTFNYQPGDVLAAFREAGSPDLIIDLGSVSNFQQPGATSMNFSGVASALTTTYGSLNGIYWSVFAYAANSTYAPVNTLWMTDPRSNVNTQNTAPITGTSSEQNNVTGQLGAIVDALSANYGTIIANQEIQLPTSLGSGNGGDPASYTTALGPGLDFNGTFGQLFENLSPSSATSVSDFFQQNPSPLHSPGTGTYLGDFSLGSNGSFSFVPAPEPSTWAMLGTGLFTLLAVRRNINRK
jgi:PEP-CTERM motif